MATAEKWFPDARKLRYGLITTTTAFMNVAENRDRIGFEKTTPSGVWYDSVYSPKQSAYDWAYRKWIDPATSTQLALSDLKDAEKAFFPLYREFHAMVKASPLVTDADLQAMGFPPRPSGERSPHSVEHMRVDLNAKAVGNLGLSVAFENRDTGSSAVPYYLTGVVLYYSFSDTQITDQSELTHSKLATRSPHEFTFDPKDRGKMIYLAGRWQNRRGELGPWSEIVALIVP
jgi:hypothetical protein